MKKISKILITCLLLVSMLVTAVPSGAKAAAKSKVAVPTSIVRSYIAEDTGEASPYTVDYKIKYDKNGRIKKITSVSHITDSEWTTTFTYKKSGKNTKVTARQDTSWGEDADTYTYKFDKLGRPLSSHKSSKWECGFLDDSKDTLYASADDAYLLFFNKKGQYTEACDFYDGKVGALSYYFYEKGKLTSRSCYAFEDNVQLADISDELLEGLEPSIYLYKTKTTKKSVTDSVKWMNVILLYDFIYCE